MKIAAYCRVSTDKDEQIDSLIHQKEFFREYARRNGHELYGLYADEGISGTSLRKREEFKRLLLDAEAGLFQMVVVKDISRFARNTVDALQSIRKLKSMGINTLFLTANMDSMGDSEFILTLFSAMAQEESNNLSKRVKWGKRINAEKGRVPQQIFGYDRIDNFTLAINQEEARIVQKIFSLYTQQGLGCRTISLTLNAACDQTKFGKDWNPRGVRRVLTNPIYCGNLINHKYEIEDFLTGKQIPVPKEEQFLHQRPDWAIVSPEVFQKAQQILEDRRKKYDSGASFPESRYSSRHLFSTLIKCPHCGRSFCRKTYTYRNTRIYWKCVTNDQHTAQRCDNTLKLDEPELLNQLRRFFTSMIPDTDIFTQAVLTELREQLPAPNPPNHAEKELSAKRERLLLRKGRYQELYANELISMSELKEKTGKIMQELQEIDAAIKGIAPSAEDKQELFLSHCQKEIPRFLAMESFTNQDMRRIIDHIAANQDGTIRVVLKNLESI